MSDDSAWLRKNVCADDGGTSIAPLVGSQINHPCEQDSQSDLSRHQQLLTELTSSAQTTKLLRPNSAQNCSISPDAA